MCAPLAQTRDMGRIAAPDENCLEASGCKDLQPVIAGLHNLLILTRKPIYSDKQKRRSATLTKCERGSRLRVKGLHVMALKISESWLKKQAAPAFGATTFWDSGISGFGLRFFAPSSRRPGIDNLSGSVVEIVRFEDGLAIRQGQKAEKACAVTRL
jgi:hypothetical protein